MHELKKALAIRFSSIGDIILASPALRVLRAAFPHAHIDFVTKAEYSDLVRFNPYLTSLILLESGDDEELKRLRARIRYEKYDTIIDLHNSLRSRYLRWMSGARTIRVVKKRAVERFALVNLKRNWYRQPIVPVAQRYLEVLKSFGVEDDHGGLEVFVPTETTTSVNALMSGCRLGEYRTVIGLVPSGKHFTKRWPSDRFAAFGARAANQFGAKLIIFGGKNDVDNCGDIAQLINRDSSKSVAESFAGRLSLLETAAAMDHCEVVVSNDTGLMHLAAARKRKVVAIFGSTVKEFGFFPYAKESVVLERAGLPCRPCTHIGREQCPEGHFKCMKEIEVEDVLEAVHSYLRPVA